MRETIVGSTIIAVGIIAASFIINQKNDYRPHHSISDQPPTPETPMAWVDKEMGEISLGDKNMVFLTDDGEKHIVMKKMKKLMSGHEEERKIVIKMESDDSDSIEETITEIIDDVADDIGDAIKDLRVNISVNIQSEKSDAGIQSLTEDIVDSVNDAVKGLSGEVNIDIQINENG